MNSYHDTNKHNIGDQGVPDPNDNVEFGFGAAAAASHWVSEAGCSEQKRAAPPSEWDRQAAAIDGGPRRVTTVTAHGGTRRVTAGRCEWLGLRLARWAVESEERRAAASDLGRG